MPLKAYFIKFHRAYHVGWNRPEKIIDHSTILRALLNLAYMTKYDRLIKSVLKGKIRASALLPTIPSSDGRKLLVPFPQMPSKVRITKVGVEWATLKSVTEISSFATKCLESKGRVFLESVKNGEVQIKCKGIEEYLKLNVERKIVHADDEHITPTTIRFERIVEYHNRIDRVTGSADLYPLTGYCCNVPLCWIVDLPGDIAEGVTEFLKVLSGLGLGGFRGRGWGRFTLLEDLKLSNVDYDLIRKYGKWTPRRYHILLGCLLAKDNIIDEEHSFVKIRIIGGYGGSSVGTYMLPVLAPADVGSMVFVKQVPKPYIEEVTMKLNDYIPLIIFNPIAISG